MFSQFLLSLQIATACSFPVIDPRDLFPTVTIQNGTLIGKDSGKVQSFNGIPYAQPPVGPLRLKPPQSINATYGTKYLYETPTSCPQQTSQDDQATLAGLPADVLSLVLNTPLFQKVQGQGEDCLTMNVQRPSTANATSKLPVVFWIYGGGFEFGSTSMYDGTNIVEKSMDLGKDIIYVSVNHRISGFGFLASKELSEDGSTNLGLRDQRLGLQWTAENIAAFGGDPDKVTIWGESAGSISVFDQTIINGGDHTYNGKPLFRGAIMDSGSVVPANPVDAAFPQSIYNTVVKNGGCSSSANTLECLRGLDYSTFLSAVNSVPNLLSYRSLDLSYLPRPDPHDNFFPASPDTIVLTPSSGNPAIAQVPIIIGDQEDEGTLFGLATSNISTTAELITYLQSYFPNANQQDIEDLVALYPDDPSAGSPFRTGELNNIYPEFKRIAALLGDATFTLTRRAYLSVISNFVPSYSYLSTYFHGTPILGTFHATDILNVYFEVQPEPAAAIQTYYVAFVNDLDPNSLGTKAPLIEWPLWKNDTRELLEFGVTENGLLNDTFRDEAGRYLMANVAKFRV